MRNLVKIWIGGFILFLFLNNSLPLAAQNRTIDSLFHLLQKEKSDTARIHLLNQLAFLYLHTAPACASDDVTIALKSSLKLNFIPGIAESYKNLGGISISAGNYPEALSYYYKAEEYYKMASDDKGIAYCYNNIGQVYKLLKEYDKSLKYFIRSIEIKKKIGTSNSLFISYNNVAELHLLENEIDEANEYYHLVLNSSQAKPAILIYTNLGLGKIAVKKGLYSVARGYFSAAENHIEFDNNWRDLAELNNQQAMLYQQLSLVDSAKFHYQKALEMATKIGAKDILLSTYHGLMKIDSTEGNYKKALKHYQTFNNLKDSLVNQQTLNQIAHLDVQYATDLLQKQNEVNLARVKQQNAFIIGIVMLMFLFIAVAGIFYKQQKNHQRINYLLASKNNEINSQKEEIQLQAKKLSALNQQLGEVNENLEKEVKERTEILLNQNRKLAEYAYTNAHELRAPVANILGLVNLLQYSTLSEKENEIVEHITKATLDLDKVIITIREKLEEETYSVNGNN